MARSTFLTRRAKANLFGGANTLRIVHLSDVHVWRFSFNPLLLLNKRAWGMASLVASRARRFRLERLPDVVDRIREVEPDHLLITGDLTTTALAGEFKDVLERLSPLLENPLKVTVVPGNHDRYTVGSMRNRQFERSFHDYMPEPSFPWLRKLDEETAILGLDPTQARFSAKGFLPPEQLSRAKELLSDPLARPKRLFVACHYPLTAPDGHKYELAGKRVTNAKEIAEWLATIGPHIYCCGHVHAHWTYKPHEIPLQLSVNAGAPILRDASGMRPPGFAVIELEGGRVRVSRHSWFGNRWHAETLHEEPTFFGAVQKV